MSRSIRDTSASGIVDAHSPTDADTTTTTSPIDAGPGRTRVHVDGPSDRDDAGRRRWSR